MLRVLTEEEIGGIMNDSKYEVDFMPVPSPSQGCEEDILEARAFPKRLPPPQYHPLLANPQHGSNSEAAAV
jgi:hypothetical protein